MDTAATQHPATQPTLVSGVSRPTCGPTVHLLLVSPGNSYNEQDVVHQDLLLHILSTYTHESLSVSSVRRYRFEVTAYTVLYPVFQGSSSHRHAHDTTYHGEGARGRHAAGVEPEQPGSDRTARRTHVHSAQKTRRDKSRLARVHV